MTNRSILTRYLDPAVLSRLAGRRIEPRGLVLGNLAGAHASPASGFAVEFSGHREYVWGDDPKHIDWRVFFTRDKYVVKQYQMETNLVCHLVLDVSASMRYGEGQEQKLRYSSNMAAALAYAVVNRSDKVSLATCDERVLAWTSPSNSPAQVVRIAGQLADVEPKRPTKLGECLAELAGRLRRREIVMVFSDFFSELASLAAALDRLRFQRHEVVLFQTLHHDELAFEFDGCVKFVGLETTEAHLTDAHELRRAYLAALARYHARFDELCGERRVERVLVDTSRNVGEVLVDYLNQRGLRRRRW
ncbi:MAG TPA: DUF58 domain-containing protein [Pirellulales bacterium]|jgi:uncharacterized protein (DUF58 family)|nr:DUF58 domain-containing protein [Pirellulales bacterium]